jgi:putative lipoprotein
VIANVALALQLGAARDAWFGPDKLKHFFVAAFTQSVSYAVLQAARVRHDRALTAAWGMTAVVSVGKELHDRRNGGLFSVRDLVWDAAGAGVATILIDRSVRRSITPDSAQGSGQTSVLSPLAPGSILRRVSLPDVVPRR